MGSVLLVIHLMVAILLVALILMQRNSGNALSGLGGGNGADSFLSARGKGNLLTRTTAILATIFFITSILLSLYYKGETRKTDSITEAAAPLTQSAPEVPAVPDATAENAAPATEAPVAETTEPVAPTEATPEATEPVAPAETAPEATEEIPAAPTVPTAE